MGPDEMSHNQPRVKCGLMKVSGERPRQAHYLARARQSEQRGIDADSPREVQVVESPTRATCTHPTRRHHSLPRVELLLPLQTRVSGSYVASSTQRPCSSLKARRRAESSQRISREATGRRRDKAGNRLGREVRTTRRTVIATGSRDTDGSVIGRSRTAFSTDWSAARQPAHQTTRDHPRERSGYAPG
ncbi:hypothetical protein OH76DRAFT_1199353 [Lentinus brumalis]|uniref:Uncharacterized protein n=1 Tax=Lentinus brumalis TaxID=2498619 RepID=A0A371CT50_9APHY|nr:hypothetical protein OH76DRAFT_1199353 [Polyporus brumalis]